MRLFVHPENPQARLMQQIASSLRDGGLICYPTDSTYAFGWLPTQKAPAERVARLRKLSNRHLYAVAVRDLKQASEFGKMDNQAFSVMKAHTPGPVSYTHLPTLRCLCRRTRRI